MGDLVYIYRKVCAQTYTLSTHFENKWAQFVFLRIIIEMSEIGERIREAASRCDTVEKMAELAGIPRRTLYNYLKGPREPKAAQLAAISRVTGVTLEWLITGEGEMLDDMSKAPAPTATVDPELMERLHDLIASIFHDVGQKPPQRRITREVANLYNELAKAVQDTSDQEMVEAVLPMVTLEFKRRLQRASDEPGTGKRSAS
jgi:transcriptional regulator with XRE-family HTH domain